MNLRELGELPGLSKERVRRIKERALEKLKKIKAYRGNR
jgi:DNA-directed RNA polymerase sigma subunit (sigma70/sigma32)